MGPEIISLVEVFSFLPGPLDRSFTSLLFFIEFFQLLHIRNNVCTNIWLTRTAMEKSVFALSVATWYNECIKCSSRWNQMNKKVQVCFVPLFFLGEAFWWIKTWTFLPKSDSLDPSFIQGPEYVVHGAGICILVDHIRNFYHHSKRCALQATGTFYLFYSLFI